MNKTLETDIDKTLHRFMAINYKKTSGAVEVDGYRAFYHEARLYSVRHIESGVVSLVYALNPYKAIEIVKGGGVE